jgi:hypothetical protein
MGNFISVVKAWSNFEPAICEQLLLSPVVHINVAVRVKQCTYKRNIEAHSRNNFRSGKAISLIILSVFEALVIQHAKPMLCIML